MRHLIGIIRVDHHPSRTHAWVVTIQRRNRIHTGHFSDGVCGGKEAALEAAVRYRDYLVRSLPPLSRRALCSIKKKNNRSGTSGVTRIEQYETIGDRKRLRIYWVAQWPTGNGRAKQKKFSVRVYGERGAYLLAMRARKQGLQSLPECPAIHEAC